MDVADSDNDTEPDEEVLVGDDRINDDMANAPTPRSEATTDERDEPSPVGTHTATESDESASDEVASIEPTTNGIRWWHNATTFFGSL